MRFGRCEDCRFMVSFMRDYIVPGQGDEEKTHKWKECRKGPPALLDVSGDASGISSSFGWATVGEEDDGCWEFKTRL